MNSRTALALLAALVVACGGSPPPEPAPIAPVVQPAPTVDPMLAEDPPEPAPEPPKAPEPAVRWADGLSTPEAVLWDEAADRYLVSNINGKPLDADGNGYISELSPDGKVLRAKFVEGGAGKTKLDAPKGMGIAKGVLYVTDITVVRKFDAKTGAPKGDIAIEGATFLNDVAVAADGRVYVSDSGMKAGAKDFEPSGTDAVYVIDKNKAKVVAKSADLGRPNGLWATDKGVLVVTFGSNELYRLDEKGAKAEVTKLPNGGLDGIAPIGDAWLVSSWQGSAVYKGTLGGSFEVAVPAIEAPADIAYDSKRKRVLVPRFMGNAVEAYAIE